MELRGMKTCLRSFDNHSQIDTKIKIVDASALFKSANNILVTSLIVLLNLEQLLLHKVTNSLLYIGHLVMYLVWKNGSSLNHRVNYHRQEGF